jgi:hypothetical protein
MKLQLTVWNGTCPRPYTLNSSPTLKQGVIQAFLSMVLYGTSRIL